MTEEEFAKIAKEVYGYSDDFIADTLNRHRECIEAGLIPPPLEDELWYCRKHNNQIIVKSST